MKTLYLFLYIYNYVRHHKLKCLNLKYWYLINYQEISVVPHLLYQHGPRCSPWCSPQYVLFPIFHIKDNIYCGIHKNNMDITNWGQHRYKQIWNNTCTTNWEQHRCNKSGTTHIRNYFVDHIDMTNWGQHILESTSGTQYVWQTGDNKYWGLHTGLHWKPYRYDKLRTTHIGGYIRDTILDHANTANGGQHISMTT